MKKKSSHVLVFALTLLIYTIAAHGVADHSVDNPIRSMQLTREAGDFTVQVDGFIDSSGVGTAQAFEAMFPLIDLSEAELILQRSFDGFIEVSSNDKNIIGYLNDTGDQFSCSYGDVEYLSSRYLSAYDPLYPMAKGKGPLSKEERATNALLPEAFSLIQSGISNSENICSDLFTVFSLNREEIKPYNSNEGNHIKPANAFCCILAPVFFHGLPVVEESLVTLSGSTIPGTQQQVILSEDGLEFYYSGRSFLPLIEPLNSEERCMSFESALDSVMESFGDIILSEPEILKISGARVLYVAYPQDTVLQRYMYIPYWFFYHDSGVIALNALTGERLL